MNDMKGNWEMGFRSDRWNHVGPFSAYLGSMYVCAHTRLEVDMEQMEEKGADSCRSMIFNRTSVQCLEVKRQRMLRRLGKWALIYR